MRRLIACVFLAGLVMWLGESSVMAQGASQNQSTLSAPNTTTPGTTAGGTSTSPTATTPGGSNLNQATGAQPTLVDFGTGFVGGSQNQGRFVGSQFAGQQQARGGGTGMNMFGGGRGGARGGSGRFTMPNQASRNRGRTRGVRPSHRVAFTFQSRSMVSIKTSLDTRFSMLLASRPQFKAVTIAVGKPGELTLAGEVPTAAAQRMAAAMARMEPGVRTVTNQLTVAAAAPAGGE